MYYDKSPRQVLDIKIRELNDFVDNLRRFAIDEKLSVTWSANLKVDQEQKTNNLTLNYPIPEPAPSWNSSDC